MFGCRKASKTVLSLFILLNFPSHHFCFKTKASKYIACWHSQFFHLHNEQLFTLKQVTGTFLQSTSINKPKIAIMLTFSDVVRCLLWTLAGSPWGATLAQTMPG